MGACHGGEKPHQIGCAGCDDAAAAAYIQEAVSWLQVQLLLRKHATLIAGKQLLCSKASSASGSKGTQGRYMESPVPSAHGLLYGAQIIPYLLGEVRHRVVSHHSKVVHHFCGWLSNEKNLITTEARKGAAEKTRYDACTEGAPGMWRACGARRH